MFEDHPKLDCPADDTVIWRYFTLPKFIWLLDQRALWFSRVDLLEDPWEGAYTKSFVEGFLKHGQATGEADRYKKHLDKMHDERQLHTVNCWHSNPNESAAMWKLYSEGQQCVAVRGCPRSIQNARKELRPHCLSSHDSIVPAAAAWPAASKLVHVL